ncbi:MAG: MlaD family protein [Candidatus Omnitrophica bacterium]|nr:MlaD family protein [Candidatus Omnitrophota bacterium]
MAEKSGLEFKVGIFVFISLTIFVVFILLIGDFKDWTSRYDIKIIFGFVDGVKAGSPVRFAGFDIGEVKKVDVVNSFSTNSTQVEVIARLKGHVKIPADSRAFVNTLGLLGEKYIEIMPGKDYRQILKDKDTLVGNDPVAMHEIMFSAYNAVDDFRKTIEKLKSAEGTIAKLLYDDKLYRDLEEFVEDIKKYPWKLFYRTKEKKTDIPPAPKTNIKPR